MGVFYIFLFPLVLIIFIKKYAFVPLVKCSKMACLWDFLKIPTKGKVIVLRTGYIPIIGKEIPYICSKFRI